MKFKKNLTVIILLGVTFTLVMWTQIDFEYMFRGKPKLNLPTIKYVLQWTLPYTEPFIYMGEGQDTFIYRNCSKINCFVTADRYYFDDITEFDVLLFHGPELYVNNRNPKNLMKMPSKRSYNQSYIFVSMESSAYYPVDEKLNNYFNYTWTYKLTSDIFYGYMIIKDLSGNVIGPKVDMNWMNIDDMLPIQDNVKDKLANKKTAVAWFVSNCDAISERNKLASNITNELMKYDMVVDVYGKCGNKFCPRNSGKRCMKIIQENYFFYFAFENSLAQDYVTEKLLKPLQNYAVPVVYGGANYTRFMPDGTYLNANMLSVEELVKQIVESIRDRSKYYNFFKWHNHYSYHKLEEAPDTDPYCKFCENINKKEFNDKTSIWRDFSAWWNLDSNEKGSEKG